MVHLFMGFSVMAGFLWNYMLAFSPHIYMMVYRHDMSFTERDSGISFAPVIMAM
jgi:hypothetical protein